jgi:hypothetical protein
MDFQASKFGGQERVLVQFVQHIQIRLVKKKKEEERERVVECSILF